MKTSYVSGNGEVRTITRYAFYPRLLEAHQAFVALSTIPIIVYVLTCLFRTWCRIGQHMQCNVTLVCCRHVTGYPRYIGACMKLLLRCVRNVEWKHKFFVEERGFTEQTTCNIHEKRRGACRVRRAGNGANVDANGNCALCLVCWCHKTDVAGLKGSPLPQRAEKCPTETVNAK